MRTTTIESALTDRPLVPHPCTEIFPPMHPEEFEGLKADIEQNGQREPIVVDQQHRIVDGLHRFRVCVLLDIKPKIDWRSLTDKEAWALSISRNYHRRHLSGPQRAAIAAEIRAAANLPLTQADAAKMFNVSERSLRSAEAVLEASPDLHRALKNDGISIHAAEKIAKLPGDERQEIIAAIQQNEVIVAKTKVKAAKLKNKSKKSELPKTVGIPHVFGALFAELDVLPVHLKHHPLQPDHAVALVAALRAAIDQINQSIPTLGTPAAQC